MLYSCSFYLFCSVCEKTKVNLMHNKLMIEMGLLAVSTLMNVTVRIHYSLFEKSSHQIIYFFHKCGG